MNDLISRQAAIDEIKAVYEWHDMPTEERMIQHFKALPSAQRWIPVTKRLPENDDECLTILEDGLYYVQAYSDGEWYYDDVVAWMPLPEPYQEKE